jgi:hypothetical protein
MRNDPKQGRWPYTEQAGEVPHQTPNGTVRHEGNRSDTPYTMIKDKDGMCVLIPGYTWPNGNRTGEG